MAEGRLSLSCAGGPLRALLGNSTLPGERLFSPKQTLKAAA